MRFNLSIKPLFFLLPLICLFFYNVYTLRNDIIDDAYITLTYAKHFWQYGKPYYTINDVNYGNGQTSIAWMLINSLSFAFKSINHVFYIKVINCILAAIVVFDFLKNSWNNFLKDYIISVPFLFIFIFILSLNASHGLETILYFTILYFILKFSDNIKGSLFSFFLPLVRPEGIIFTVIQVFYYKSKKDLFNRILILSGSIFTLALYQYIFFDELIPLPFLLKNIREFSPLKINYFLEIFCFFTPLIFFYYKEKKLLEIVPLIFFIVYYSFFVDGVMNFFQRYSFPLFAYYLIFFQRYYNPKMKKQTLWCFIPMVFYLYAINEQKILFKYEYSKSKIIDLGKHISKLGESGNETVLTSDAGAVAFFSNKRCIDIWGLNNATLLKYNKSKDWNNYLDYIKKQNPKYIILISDNPETFVPNKDLEFETKIFENLNLSNQKVNSVWKGGKNYYYFLYIL